ncbi:MAG: hypothetical protein ABFS45_16065 [Pseudomonadota bacterium]
MKASRNWKSDARARAALSAGGGAGGGTPRDGQACAGEDGIDL